MINKLLIEREEYRGVEWESRSGERVLIYEISNEYLLNVLKKVWQKSIMAQQLEYVEEYQTYRGIQYSAYVRYFYNEYLYRKHEGIVIEDKDKVSNIEKEAAEFFNTEKIIKSKNIYRI